MNPYLQAKIAEYEHHRAAIADVRELTTREGREATEAEMRAVVDHGGKAKALFGEIEEISGEELRSAKVADLAAQIGEATSGASDGGASAPERKGMYSLLPSDEQLAQLRSAVAESRGLRFTTRQLPRDVQEHMRAAVTISLTGGRIGGMSGALPEPRRLATAVGLTPVPSTTAGVSGPKFGATSAAAGTAEGATKPEAATITKLDVVPKQLARWTTLSRMALLSTSDMLEQLLSWHAMFIAKDEDKLIIDALNTAAGSAVAFVAGDQRPPVRAQMAVVEDAVAAQCDAVICHPDNYGLLAGFDPTDAGEAGGRVVRFGGAVLYPSSSCPTGFALVAAVRAGGAFIMADPPSVASTESLSTNETTVRTEEIAGFDVRLVGCVKKIDVVTP